MIRIELPDGNLAEFSIAAAAEITSVGCFNERMIGFILAQLELDEGWALAGEQEGKINNLVVMYTHARRLIIKAAEKNHFGDNIPKLKLMWRGGKWNARSKERIEKI